MNKIGKRTNKMTKEAKAKKIFDGLSDEKREALYVLIGKIACGEIKNFYATKVFKTMAKDFTTDERAVVTYICSKVGRKGLFEDMDELFLVEG